ncbi:MAG: S24 family peptidase [Deltaproteobacteria bacterium]
MNKPNELGDPNQHLLPDLTTQLLRDGKSVRFHAPGRSMYPTIREGEAIKVEPILPSEVKVGDIILYRSDDGVIAHRVARIERGEKGERRFILRADTWGEYDEPVDASQIMGKVVSTERGGRSINPYCTGAKARLLIHTIASRLKRHIL